MRRNLLAYESNQTHQYVFCVYDALPMVTCMAVEKVKKAGRNYKLILLTQTFAFIIASITAYFVSRRFFVNQPDLALSIILVGAIPCFNMLISAGAASLMPVWNMALVIAFIGLLLIPFVSTLIIKFSDGPILPIDTIQLSSI